MNLYRDGRLLKHLRYENDCFFSVVKLFNAVSAHQKLVSEKMKEAKTEARKTKGTVFYLCENTSS